MEFFNTKIFDIGLVEPSKEYEFTFKKIDKNIEIVKDGTKNLIMPTCNCTELSYNKDTGIIVGKIKIPKIPKHFEEKDFRYSIQKKIDVVLKYKTSYKIVELFLNYRYARPKK